MCCCLIETFIGSSSKIYVNLRKFSENVWKRLSGLGTIFGESSEIFKEKSRQQNSTELNAHRQTDYSITQEEFIRKLLNSKCSNSLGSNRNDLQRTWLYTFAHSMYFI